MNLIHQYSELGLGSEAGLLPKSAVLETQAEYESLRPKYKAVVWDVQGGKKTPISKEGIGNTEVEAVLSIFTFCQSSKLGLNQPSKNFELNESVDPFDLVPKKYITEKEMFSKTFPIPFYFTRLESGKLVLDVDEINREVNTKLIQIQEQLDSQFKNLQED